MSDYIPADVVIRILKRLPVKSLVKFRSVCKSWNSLISHPSFISTHLQASLPNNTPFLLFGCEKKGKTIFSLHYDNDGFEKSKELQFPPFACVFGSCNGLICVRLYPYVYDHFNFVIWNPSIGKYISLPHVKKSEVMYINAGFGFDSRTDDYKLLMVGVDKHYSWFGPYLFSFNENCWKRITAAYPNYGFHPQMSMPFVNGAVHWLGYQKRNDGGYGHMILGFDLSAESFFEIKLPESLIGLLGLSIMKYGDFSIAVTTHPAASELHELWVMKEYGVVESWTKLLKLNRVDRNTYVPRVLGFRKNGEVLLQVRNGEIASLDLNCQQTEAPLYLNCQQMELHGVEVEADLLSVNSYVESLVLLDKSVNVHSENDLYHPVDSDDSSGGEGDVA